MDFTDEVFDLYVSRLVEMFEADKKAASKSQSEKREQVPLQTFVTQTNRQGNYVQKVR